MRFRAVARIVNPAYCCIFDATGGGGEQNESKGRMRTGKTNLVTAERQGLSTPCPREGGE